LLQLEPFENISTRLDRKADQVFELEPKGAIPAAVDSDPVLGGKCDFIIVDTSANGLAMVREKDGNIRPASKVELWKLQHNKPDKYQM
jgi:hypothetical protein